MNHHLRAANVVEGRIETYDKYGAMFYLYHNSRHIHNFNLTEYGICLTADSDTDRWGHHRLVTKFNKRPGIKSFMKIA